MRDVRSVSEQLAGKIRCLLVGVAQDSGCRLQSTSSTVVGMKHSEIVPFGRGCSGSTAGALDRFAMNLRLICRLVLITTRKFTCTLAGGASLAIPGAACGAALGLALRLVRGKFDPGWRTRT